MKCPGCGFDTTVCGPLSAVWHGQNVCLACDMFAKRPKSLDKVSRFELIDETGRRVVLYVDKQKFTLSLQDGGATLKLFATGIVQVTDCQE